MKDLRAVLFDLDGVLIDSYQVWHRLLQAAAEHFGAPPIDADAFRAMWGQGVDADSEVLGRPVAELERFYHERFGSFCDVLAIDPASAPVLERVHAAGLGSAVVTNTPTPLARDILATARLAPRALVGGTDVPRPKPAPDMVLRACELLKVRPSAAVLVGDSTFDRDAADAAQTRFVGLRIDGYRRIESLEQLPALLAI